MSSRVFCIILGALCSSSWWALVMFEQIILLIPALFTSAPIFVIILKETDAIWDNEC